MGIRLPGLFLFLLLVQKGLSSPQVPLCFLTNGCSISVFGFMSDWCHTVVLMLQRSSRSKNSAPNYDHKEDPRTHPKKVWALSSLCKERAFGPFVDSHPPRTVACVSRRQPFPAGYISNSLTYMDYEKSTKKKSTFGAGDSQP